MTTIKVDSNSFARGAFGDVHMGILGDSTHVTVKYIAIDMTETPAVIQLVRELRVLRTLRHPNLLSLDGIVYSNSGSIGIVTKRYEMNLSKLVTVDCTTRRKFVFQALSSALAHLHKHGCIHCDVKPQNVFVSVEREECVLGDFGLVQPDATSTLDQQEYIVTSWYRPPELVFDVSRRYDCKVDVWSLGCILAEMILGHPLFIVTEKSSLLAHQCTAFSLPCGIYQYDSLRHLETKSSIHKWLKQKFEESEYEEASTEEWKLLTQTLVFDSERRCSAYSLANDGEPGATRDTLCRVGKDCNVALNAEVQNATHFIEQTEAFKLESCATSSNWLWF